MQLTVTPHEIAQHMIEELGHNQAMEETRRRLDTCQSNSLSDIWQNISNALEDLHPGERR